MFYPAYQEVLSGGLKFLVSGVEAYLYYSLSEIASLCHINELRRQKFASLIYYC